MDWEAKSAFSKNHSKLLLRQIHRLEETTVDRRMFISGAAAVAAAGLAAARGASPAASQERSVPRDDADRSPGRDPWAIMRSTLVVDGLDPSALTEHYVGMLKAGGVHCWHRTAGDVDDFATEYRFLDKHSDRIVPATTVRAIREARQQNKIALLFGWQGAGLVLPSELNPLVPVSTPLRAYYQLGLRIVGLAYNIANEFGGGNLDPDVGLTSLGRRLVSEIHELRIVLDVAGHTNEKTSFEAIAISQGVPVICSHSNVRALNENPRCISDPMVEAIAKTGGVIGISTRRT
jgi:membrane dipeptidase